MSLVDTINVTLTLPALLAQRVTADAEAASLPLERHILQVLFGEALRADALRDRQWSAENPADAAARERDDVLDEIEREVARLVEDGMPAADADTIAQKLLAEYEVTLSPGYLDPANAALPMTAERHIAILRAAIRAERQQHVAEVRRRAQRYSDGGDQASAARLTAEADRLQQRRLP